MLSYLKLLQKYKPDPNPAYQPITKEAIALKLLFERLSEIEDFEILKALSTSFSELYKLIDNNEQIRDKLSTWLNEIKEL